MYLTSSHLFAEVDSLNTVNNSFSPSVVCSVYFGTPDNLGNCVQIGVCKVIVDQTAFSTRNTKEEKRCRVAHAHVYIGDAGNLEMFFPKSGILPCTERAIFRNKWLPVPVACSLPNELNHTLNYLTNNMITTGNYPIIETEDGYIISY